MRIEVLAERVRQKLVNKADKQVFVRSDGRLEVQKLIDVLDRAEGGRRRERRHRDRLPGPSDADERTTPHPGRAGAPAAGARHMVGVVGRGAHRRGARICRLAAARVDGRRATGHDDQPRRRARPNTGGTDAMAAPRAAPVQPEAPGTAPPPPADAGGTEPVDAVKRRRRPRSRRRHADAQAARRRRRARPSREDTPADTGRARPGLRAQQQRRRRRTSVELDVSNFCCPEYIDTMVLVIQRELGQEPRCRGAHRRHLHHPSRRHVDGVAVRQIERLLRARQRGAARRWPARSCRRCRRSSRIRRSRFTSPSNTSSMMRTHTFQPRPRPRARRRRRSWRARLRRPAQQPPTPQPQAAAAADRGRARDQRRHAARRRVSRCPISSRSRRPEPRRPRKTIGQVLWDDSNFEREFYLIPRDTYATDAGGAIGGADVPFASLARTRRRRRHLRHRAAHRRQGRACRCGCSTSHAAGGLREGVQRHRVEPARSTRTRSPTRFTSSSARSAASRARSWRSPRIATRDRVAGTVETAAR